jgi:L,D-transpeptidase ErfK/SrfK
MSIHAELWGAGARGARLRALARVSALTLLAGLAGCQIFAPDLAPDAAARPAPAWVGIERSDIFESVSPKTRLVGRLQKVIAREEDTFPDLARRFNLGYEELVAANPGVDPWLPGEGTEIVLPTAHVIPEGPREGVVVNVAALRLWWFGEPGSDGRQTVITHPIGIGRVGWSTPLAETTVVSKTADPTWYPPASVRKEHAEAGDPLPGVVPPGPDNPLGGHAIYFALPSYLMHGTNKPWGVGMRVSHGCIRLYPEDIEALFDRIGRGTKVRIVDQPWLGAWLDGELYFEAHAPLEDGDRDWTAAIERLAVLADGTPVDWIRAGAISAAAAGYPVPVTASTPPPDDWLALAPRVDNRPRGNYRAVALAAEPAEAEAASGAGLAREAGTP